MPYQEKARRWTYGVYSGIAAGGSVLATSPVASIEQYGPPWAVVAWHGLLILGGVCGIVGVRTRSPIAQQVGATLSAAILWTYAAVLLGSGLADGDPTRFGFGVLMLSFAAALRTIEYDTRQTEAMAARLARQLAKERP